MAEITFIYNTPKKSVGGITVDAFLSERHVFQNDVTEIPIEEGVTATDHVTERPTEITIEGFFGREEFITNSAGKVNGSPKASPNPMWRVKSKYQELRLLKEAKRPVTLVTGLDVFGGMVITSLEIPRDVSTGADLHFTMTLKKLPIVRSETIQISVANVPQSSASDAIQNTGNTGIQAKQEAKPSELEQWYKAQVQNGNVSQAEYQGRWGKPYVQ